MWFISNPKNFQFYFKNIALIHVSPYKVSQSFFLLWFQRSKHYRWTLRVQSKLSMKMSSGFTKPYNIEQHFGFIYCLNQKIYCHKSNEISNLSTYDKSFNITTSFNIYRELRNQTNFSSESSFNCFRKPLCYFDLISDRKREKREKGWSSNSPWTGWVMTLCSIASRIMFSFLSLFCPLNIVSTSNSHYARVTKGERWRGRVYLLYTLLRNEMNSTQRLIWTICFYCPELRSGHCWDEGQRFSTKTTMLNEQLEWSVSNKLDHKIF